MKNFIAGATRNKGALHRNLGVPVGSKIPRKKLMQATHSTNATIAREANLAVTLGKLRRKKRG